MNLRNDPLTVLFATPLPGFSLAAALFAETLKARFVDSSAVRFLVRNYGRSLGEVDDSFVRDVLLHEPDLVGLASFFWNQDAVRRLAAMTKSLRPQTLVVLGGPQVGLAPDASQLIRSIETVDAILCGEADWTFPELAWRLWREEDLGDLPGLVTRSGAASTPTSEVHDLRTLPLVFHAGNNYVEENLHEGGVVPFPTLRGCRRRCAYCLNGMHGLRTFPLERVEKEIAYLCGRGVRHARVTDSHFGGSRERALDLFEIIAKHNRETVFSIFPDPAQLDSAYVEAARRAGCQILSLGAQTLDPTVGADLRRGQQSGELERALETLASQGVHCQVDLMFGLPGQTAGSLCRDVAHLKALGAREFLFSPLMVFPGTEMASSGSARTRIIEGSPQAFGFDRNLGVGEYRELLLRVEVLDWLRGFRRTERYVRERLGADRLEAGLSRLPRDDVPGDRQEFLDLAARLRASSHYLRDRADELVGLVAGRLEACTGLAGCSETLRALTRFDLLDLAMHHRAAERKREPVPTRDEPPVWFWEQVLTREWRLHDEAWLEELALPPPSGDPDDRYPRDPETGKTYCVFFCPRPAIHFAERTEFAILQRLRSSSRLQTVASEDWLAQSGQLRKWIGLGVLVPEVRRGNP